MAAPSPLRHPYRAHSADLASVVCAGLGGCGPHLGGKKALGIDLVVLMAKLTQDSEKAILTSSKVGVDGVFNGIQFIEGVEHLS